MSILSLNTLPRHYFCIVNVILKLQAKNPRAMYKSISPSRSCSSILLVHAKTKWQPLYQTTNILTNTVRQHDSIAKWLLDDDMSIWIFLLNVWMKQHDIFYKLGVKIHKVDLNDSILNQKFGVCLIGP